MKKPIPNSFFNEYYPDFGDIYNLILDSSINNMKKIIEILNQKMKKFNKIEFLYPINNIHYFEETLTLSQFKAWFGLIICFYMNYNGTEISQLRNLKEIVYIISSILEENVNHYDFIRILIFLITERITNKNESNVELKFVSHLDEFSPYLLAYKFNIEQIENLNEYTPLFQAYLQFNSFEAFNYIFDKKSYTFSLEMNFMIKHRLLSAYENFFIVEKVSNRENAYLDDKTKITVINEVSIFNDNKKDINTIITDEDAQNCAVPLVINFPHEKSGHFKFILKNDYQSSPIIYFKGIRTELEIIIKEGYINGETGNIIENFICDDREIIKELSTHFIYGKLLESKYFNGNDDELKRAVKEIYEMNAKKTNGNNQLKTLKKDEKSNLNKKISSGLSRFKYGCLKSDTNQRKKELSKEKKEEIFKRNYIEKIDKFKKMKEVYDYNKKLYENINKKK